MVGALGVLQQHYLGVRFADDYMHIDPALPQMVEMIRKSIHYRGRQVGLIATHEALDIQAAETNRGAVPVCVIGERALVGPGKTVRITNKHPPGSDR